MMSSSLTTEIQAHKYFMNLDVKITIVKTV
jgi:hypothetical protein